MIEVFIPTWDNERTIKECIQSLKQTSMDVDITIVDNLSTDATVKIATSLGAKAVSLKANLGEARTWICHHAKGEWFVMVDSDAMASNRWLEQMIEHRDKLSLQDKRIGAVYCSPIERPVVNDAKLKKAIVIGSLQAEMFHRQVRKNEGRFGISLCLVRTEAAKGFSTNIGALEDILFGWFLRDSGWNYYSLPVWYYHKPLLSKENTLRRARIMGAYMHKIKYTSLAALTFNMFRVFVTSNYGSKIRNFNVYLNLIVGWLTHERYTHDYKWGQG
ncbi:glycosyltransferase family 2 protein [Candidatus Bathyarchaeota archaeon A05DMB-2]|jgi:glycosyltransferase involved in cell wall biosynthesis|nr:glycosyltransferase family 2 protein [Candidatus Bathyarchaeota archaeon A05DMB-2]